MKKTLIEALTLFLGFSALTISIGLCIIPTQSIILAAFAGLGLFLTTFIPVIYLTQNLD